MTKCDHGLVAVCSRPDTESIQTVHRSSSPDLLLKSTSSLLLFLCLLQDRLDHLVANALRLRKSWSKVCLYLLKLLLVRLKRSEIDSFAPILLFVSQVSKVDKVSCSLTLAANVNSRSSPLNKSSPIAVLIVSSSKAGVRKRYSVIPSHIRNSCTSN